ncbi:MAG TPA: hypothetical protein DCS28_01645, partial [Candidatus Moranbacteria bacterium]|nr:hypothetical protein [Candidatus Moranbacteria bacterium]HAT74728.1 hypothetical protein [Candidatus Moranbacteria bacterium]
MIKKKNNKKKKAGKIKAGVKKTAKKFIKRKKVSEKKPTSKKTRGRFTAKIKEKPHMKAREGKNKIVLSKKEERKIARQEEKKNLIDDLVYRSKQRGFITEDEILHSFPDAERDIEKLEELYENLEENSIKVISSDEMIKFETDKISENFEKDKSIKKGKTARKDNFTAGISDDVSSDLVQMYLREIG